MSKKSRRRNKKILGALGALGLGLALANRGKGTEMSNISVDSGRGGDSASAKARAIANAVTTENTIKDNMPIVPKKTNVVKTGDVLGRMRGSGPESGVVGQKKRADYAQKQAAIAADIKRNDALRALRSDRAMRGDMMTTPDSIIEGVPLEDYMISAKKGGRIVKGKKTAVRKVGIAKRGFGRAMKRSK